jgi:hypothetical protein
LNGEDDEKEVVLVKRRKSEVTNTNVKIEPIEKSEVTDTDTSTLDTTKDAEGNVYCDSKDIGVGDGEGAAEKRDGNHNIKDEDTKADQEAGKKNEAVVPDHETKDAIFDEDVTATDLDGDEINEIDKSNIPVRRPSFTTSE